MSNIGADKGELQCKTISTTQKHTNVCCPHANAGAFAIAGYSVAQTDAIAPAVPARSVSTGSTSKVGYR